MTHLIYAVILGCLTVLGVSLRKAYNELPVLELKRRAQRAEPAAQLLYRAVSYGDSLQLLLWLWIGLSAAGLLLLIAKELLWLPALLVTATVLWLGFTWLPRTRVTTLSRQVAQKLAPVLAWLLNYLHRPLDYLAVLLRRYSSSVQHTGLYQTDDLLALLDRQQQQAEGRIAREELEVARHALTFGNKLVRDIFIPQSQVVSVKADEQIGAILMDSLHSSGHSRFPVYDGKKLNIVGVLYLHDLVQQDKSGPVRGIMQKHVVYAHEEQTLYQTLQAFLKTKRHLFIVVNRFEEVIGIVTIEDVLEQVIGRPIVDEFDQYEDLRAVAARLADKIHKEHN